MRVTAAVILLMLMLAGCATTARRVDRTDPVGAVNAAVDAAATGNLFGVALWGGLRVIDAAVSLYRSRPAPADEP